MGYVGKDFIHYGCGLELNPDKVWECVPSSVRKNIKKAIKSCAEVKKVSGSEKELDLLRSIWYYPEDPNFPTALGEEDLMYLAYIDGELVAGVILIATGTHFFLNNLTANTKGKKHRLQDYLLWYLVNELKDSDYTYIDVGVSYRYNLYKFFSKWATFKYPVIFNPPKHLTRIDFNPISSYNHVNSLKSVSIDEDYISKYFDTSEYTIVPSFKYALELTKRNIPGSFALDLSKFLPIAEAGVIIGSDISPEVLWEEYGCYDHYKTDYIKKLIMVNPAKTLLDMLSRAATIYSELVQCFKNEDVTILDIPSANVSGILYLDTENAEDLAKRYAEFGVSTKINKNKTVLGLPCHAYMTSADVEYIYAIYRGYLNLCSTWESTGVKGALKI